MTKATTEEAAEESPLLLVSEKIARRSNDNNASTKKKSAFFVVAAVAALGFLATSSTSTSSSRALSSARMGLTAESGEATNVDDDAAAYLGTLPKRTWERSGVSSGAASMPDQSPSSTVEQEVDSRETEEQQQQQQGATKPQTLRARVWQKSSNFVEEEEEKQQQQQQQQQQQARKEETAQPEALLPEQKQQAEEEERAQPAKTEEQKREEAQVAEAKETTGSSDAGVVASAATEKVEENQPKVVVEDVQVEKGPVIIESARKEEEVKEEEKQPLPKWRVNMQNIANSANDALKASTTAETSVAVEQQQQQSQAEIKEQEQVQREQIQEQKVAEEDEKEKEKQRIDAEIEEQRRQIEIENEQKRKEEEIAAAKIAEPEMGEDEAAHPQGVMENLYDIDNGRYEGEVVRVPFAFYANTKWAGADFWKHDWDTPNMSDEQKAKPDPTKFMPVFKTYGVDTADVVVTAHATDIESTGWVIIDSAKRNGLQVVISGNGTDFHGFADKMMGLKAALHSINGNPIVINSDANDVMLQCSGQEFKNRFNQANADFIFGGETQLWPEIHAYFDKTDEIAWKEKMSDTLGKIGAAGPPAQLTGEHPNVWANAGSFMARKNDMLKYIEETEQRMARHPGAEPSEWGMTCRPAGVTDEDFADVNGSGWVNWFDDQECLTSFQMRHLMERSTRHKLDADGSILFSAGGTPMDQIGKDNKNMVFHKQTGKASCLWHFNNPQAKIRLKDFANAFPDKFLTPHGREVMLSTSDEHPGNRNPGPGSSSTLSARSSAQVGAI